MMRKRKQGQAMIVATIATTTMATGMPSHGVSPKLFHSSAVT